jgi:hypothetical protein
MYDATIRSRPLEMDDAAERLTRLEKINKPTPFNRGELSAIRLCRLDPAERNRVEALTQDWSEE